MCITLALLLSIGSTGKTADFSIGTNIDAILIYSKPD